MKKLLALVALVAMVAVASVAQAATVSVSGTVNSSVTLGDCTVNLGTIGTTKSSATCTPSYDVNSANGYTIDYAIASTTLENTTTADSIASLTESTVTATTCQNSTECWSYMVASNDAGVVYGTDAGQGAAGTSYNSGEHGFAVGTDGIITDGTNGLLTGQTLTMTYYVARIATTDAGTYTSTDGTLTLTAI